MPRDRQEFLTGRQRVVLRTIGDYYRTTGEPCPARYLARRLSIHLSTVQEHLESLYRKGYLRTPNAPVIPEDHARSDTPST